MSIAEQVQEVMRQTPHHFIPETFPRPSLEVRCGSCGLVRDHFIHEEDSNG